MSFGRRTPRAFIALPIVGLLVGGTVGWFMRPTGAVKGPDGAVVGQALPTGADLDRVAPITRVPAAPNTMVVDRSAIVGYPEDLGTEVPPGALVTVSSPDDWKPVDGRTLQPVSPTPTPPAAPVVPTPLAEAPQPEPTPSTTPLPGPTATTAPVDPTKVDPCTTAVESPCAGRPGNVQTATPGERQPDPLVVSMPFAATGAYAEMCAAIEGDTVPDPFLDPALRPTIAVVTNQPSSIALTGQWDDGTPIEKLTMATSAAHEQEWQQAWDADGTQRSLLQCMTLPLDDVRVHSSEGRGALDVSLLAISATGQAQSGGPLVVTTPLDGVDTPFADQLVVGSLGEQRSTTGSGLVPTVHVHYALLADELVPPGSSLNPRTAKVYAQHELVENADCAGWARNAQGVGRTTASWVTTTQEQRTIIGRTRPVTVVDADLELDASLPGGWQGFACLHLFVADADGNRVDLAIRGAEVRSPMTAVYEIGAVVADLAVPDGWSVDATWSTSDGALWCGPASFTTTGTGGTCTTYARTVPDGVVLMLRARDDAGELRPAFLVTVPINTAYCTPDDPLAAISDGCDTGFTQTVKVPVDTEGKRSIAMTFVVRRTALAGSMETTPAHAWQISASQAFGA